MSKRGGTKIYGKNFGGLTQIVFLELWERVGGVLKQGKLRTEKRETLQEKGTLVGKQCAGTIWQIVGGEKRWNKTERGT